MSDPFGGDEGGGFEEPTAPAWMATFGDLMSLLLTFFVLLMSFASMDVRKFAAIAGSMRDAFGVQTVHEGYIESLSHSIVQLSNRESTPMLKVVELPTGLIEREQSLLDRLRRAIEARELQRVVSAEKSSRGVVLRMDEALMFGAGSADLQPQAIVFLRDVADLIEGVPGDISVEGHTDTIPATAADGSNWKLSVERAVAVVRQLADAEGVDPDRLRATAFGDTRPIASNAHEVGRSRNRRVEFVFLRTEIELPPAELAEQASGASAASEPRAEGSDS